MNETLFAEINIHWYLPPLAIVVSLVYSATRYEDWGLIFGFALRWVVYILSFLGGTYVAVWLLFQALDRDNYWYTAPVIVVAILLFGPSWKRQPKPKRTPAA